MQYIRCAPNCRGGMVGRKEGDRPVDCAMAWTIQCYVIHLGPFYQALHILKRICAAHHRFTLNVSCQEKERFGVSHQLDWTSPSLCNLGLQIIV